MKQLLIFLIALLASFGPIQAQEDTSEVKIYNKPMDDKESKSYRPKPVKTRYFMVDFGVSALHTAGLKESPQYRGHGIKTSHEINSMVSKNCHF